MGDSVVIDRRRWVPGKHRRIHSSSVLFQRLSDQDRGVPGGIPFEPSPDAMTCCLGELGLNLKLPVDTLWPRRSYPRYTPFQEQWPEVLFAPAPVKHPEWPSKLAMTWETVFALLNDYDEIDDATRESWVATGFEILLGRKVRFENEYWDGPRGEDGELLLEAVMERLNRETEGAG